MNKQLIIFILVLLAGLTQTFAAAAVIIPPAPELSARNYILLDAYSGKILAEQAADDKVAPASLTKIMTVYVAFSELHNGHLHLDDSVTISKKAWRTGGSRMFVEVNKKVSVENLLKGIIIQSGNDASVALAEHIAGDEATFAQLMNQTAQRIGMTNTHFTNSMGLPSSDHYTTARDLATLTRHLINEFPELYAWHSIKEFTFNNIKQYNRNRLLWRDESVDGVKTGYTEEAGYCLVASALRDGMRLISVVLGTSSTGTRANENQTLINYGFRFYETRKLYQAESALTETRIWKGEQEQLPLGLQRDLYITIPRNHANDLKATLDLRPQIIAPVTAGDPIGKLKIQLGSDAIAERSLVALQTIPEGSFFRRIYDEALLLLK